MANVSRIILDHPALGTAGGAGLHASIQAIYKKLGDNIADRLFYAENLNNSASVDLEHNFGVGLSDIRWDLYLWDTGTQVLTRITSTSSPTLSTFVVAETSGFEETKLTLTNNSGAQRDLVLCAFNDPINLGELADVDLVSTPPQDADGLIYDAAALKWIPGASSGLGELSVIKFGSKEGDAVASGAGITVDTTTTASELPLEGVIKSGIKITGVSGTDYVRWRWTMPDSFLNRTHKIEWEQKALAGLASGDFTLELHTNSASNYGGSYTQKSLFKGATILAADGKFTDYFDAGGELYYELRIKRAAGTASIVLANLIVGPGIQAQGAVITDWVYALTTGNWGTVTGSNLKARRVGNCLEGEFSFISGTPPAGASAIILPSGLTVNYSVASTTRTEKWGEWNYSDSGDSNIGLGSSDRGGALFTDGSTTDRVFFSYRVTAAAYVKADQNVNSGALVTGKFLIPIAEWGGANGTLNTGVNDVEYAYNTSTANSSDSTSFGYGPQGNLTGAVSSNIFRAVSFQSAIQPTDKLTLEFSSDRVQWFENNAWQYIGPTYIVMPAALQNSQFFGASIDGSHGFSLTNKQIAVKFNQYSATTGGQGYGGTGVAWPSSDLYWRVKKERAGVAVGYGAATSKQRGLTYGYTEKTDAAITNVTNLGTISVEHQLLQYTRTESGKHILKINLQFGVSGGSASNLFQFSIAGVVFRNISSFAQPLASTTGAGGFGQSASITAFTTPNTNEIRIYTTNTPTPSSYSWSFIGEVILESAPSWA